MLWLMKRWIGTLAVSLSALVCWDALCSIVARQTACLAYTGVSVCLAFCCSTPVPGLVRGMRLAWRGFVYGGIFAAGSHDSVVYTEAAVLSHHFIFVRLCASFTLLALLVSVRAHRFKQWRHPRSQWTHSRLRKPAHASMGGLLTSESYIQHSLRRPFGRHLLCPLYSLSILMCFLLRRIVSLHVMPHHGLSCRFVDITVSPKLLRVVSHY